MGRKVGACQKQGGGGWEDDGKKSGHVRGWVVENGRSRNDKFGCLAYQQR